MAVLPDNRETGATTRMESDPNFFARVSFALTLLGLVVLAVYLLVHALVDIRVRSLLLLLVLCEIGAFFLGLIGLSRVRRLGNGKGLALAGVMISGGLTVLFIAFEVAVDLFAWELGKALNW